MEWLWILSCVHGKKGGAAWQPITWAGCHLSTAPLNPCPVQQPAPSSVPAPPQLAPSPTGGPSSAGRPSPMQTWPASQSEPQAGAKGPPASVLPSTCLLDQYTSPRDYFKQKYNDVPDLIVNEIQHHFDQPTSLILHEMEKLICESCNGTKVEPSDSMYGTKVDFAKLTLKLSNLPYLLRTVNKDYNMRTQMVTSVITVCEMFNVCVFPKILLSEVDRLLHIYLLTSATAERTFSTLQRLKAYLRSTMSQKHLNPMFSSTSISNAQMT